MKFSKEARIGLLVGISLLVFFAGFYFLKGSNIFSGENEYYTYYDNIQGLQPSAPVQIKGLSVGRVAGIDLTQDGKVKVTLAVNKKVNVTEGTIARLASADLLGSKVIALELAPGTKEAADESVLAGDIEGGLLDNISTEISPLIADLRHVVGTLDTVVIGVNTMLNDSTRRRLESSIASLDVTMKNFAHISHRLNGESDEMAAIIRNANSITGNLAQSNQQITNIINNADVFSKQLSSAPVEQTFKELEQTSKQLQGVVNKINGNEGSLGLLVNDKQLYNNLSQSLSTLDLLMADLKKHPSRYINVSIFGRKSKD